MALENVAGVVIYQGEDKDINVRLADQNGDPVNLTGASELIAIFSKTDGTALVKKFTNGDVVPTNEGGGQFKIKLASADTLLLKVGDNQSIEIRVTIASRLLVAQVQGAITVLASLFPEVP